MSEGKRLSGAKQPGRSAYIDSDKNRFYGDIWLLEQVADKTGLRSDLMWVFENNEDVVNSVHTLAYFSELTGYSYNKMTICLCVTGPFPATSLTPEALRHCLSICAITAFRTSHCSRTGATSPSRTLSGTYSTDRRW